MNRWAVPASAGALATIVSTVGITTPSVWYDEAATVSAATRPLPDLVALLSHIDAVHGAYYLLMHVVFATVGYTPLSLRLVSALAVGITAAVVVMLDRRLRPGSLGILAGLVFAILPRVVWAGGEGRSFALAAAMAALLTLALLRAVDSGSRRGWIIYALAAVAGCAVFAYLALVIVAQGAAVLLMRRRMLAPWALAAGAALAVTSPMLVLIVRQGDQLPSMPGLGADTAADVVVAQWFGTSIPLALLAWVLIVAGLVRLPVLAPLVVLPTAALLLVALVNPELYQPRYLSICTPFVALAVAAGVAAIPWRLVRVVALAAVIALAVPQLVAGRAVDAKKDGWWSTVAAIVADARGERSAAVVYGPLFPHHGTTARTIAVAYPAAFQGMVDVTLDVPAAEYPDDLWGTWLPLDQSLDRLEGAEVVFFVGTSGGVDLLDAGWAPVRQWRAGDISIVEYRRA